MAENLMLFFPLLAAVLMPVTFLISYVWAVALGHVEPDFPYISSTGAYPPESNFFAFMLNIIALLMAVTVWARHRQIQDHCSQTVVGKNLPQRSKIATVFGYMAALGLCLVGNFQSSTVTSVHLTGAALAFGLGTVYQWMQSWMSLSLSPRVNSPGVTWVRFVCSATATLMLITTITFSFLHDAANEGTDVAYWTKNQAWWRTESRKKWTYHVIATSSEWILAATFVEMLLSLVPEFKRMTFQGVAVEYNRDRSEVRENTMAQSTDTIAESIQL